MLQSAAPVILAAGLGLSLLAGCSLAPMPATPAATTPPSAAEQGCLRDVAAVTNTAEVVILESFFWEAGTEVTLGVGPDRAPWRCIGYADGATDGIMSLTDEGAL